MAGSPANSHGNGYPLALAGAVSATRFVGGTASGAPASGTFAVGDFVVDQTGRIYVCTVAGTPGTWTLAGASAAVTAGAGRWQSWAPTGAIVEAYPRTINAAENDVTLTSGRLNLVGGAVIPAGQVVTSVTFFSGGVAAIAPTNQWFCLVRLSDLAVLRKTADDTNTAWGTYTAKTLNLSSTYTPASDTPVYMGVVVVAATPATMFAVAPGALGLGTNPAAEGYSTTGLTDPASLGANAAALTQQARMIYAYCS